jgi:hypothetical protein
MACSDVELLIVLANLASGGRSGESCACPGVVWMVVVWEPPIWSMSVRQLEGWAD